MRHGKWLKVEKATWVIRLRPYIFVFYEIKCTFTENSLKLFTVQSNFQELIRDLICYFMYAIVHSSKCLPYEKNIEDM